MADFFRGSLGQWTLKKKPFELDIFPTKYGIPKSLKPVSHWPSKVVLVPRQKDSSQQKSKEHMEASLGKDPPAQI